MTTQPTPSLFSSEALLSTASSLRHQLVNQGIERYSTVACIINDPYKSSVKLLALFSFPLSVVVIDAKTPLHLIAHICSLARVEALLVEDTHLGEELGFPLIHIKEVELSHGLSPAIINWNSRQLVYIPTSGTTSLPRLVAISLQALTIQGKAVCERLSMTSESVYCLSLPLSHISGLSILIRALLAKCSLAIPEKVGRDYLLPLFKRFLPTHISVVPTLLSDLTTIQASSLQKVLIGGASVTSRQIKCASHLPLVTSYGSSETGAGITFNNSPSPEFPLCMGLPLSHVKVTIGDEDFSSLPLMREGSVVVSAPSLFHGYNWQDPLTEAQSTWYSQDMGYIDTNNHLVITGRRDTIINSGGVKINPLELETIALLHPSVRLCAVVKVESVKWGETPYLFVESESDASLLRDELRHLLLFHLTKKKLPSRIIILPHLPLLPNGKIDYYLLRTTYSPSKTPTS